MKRFLKKGMAALLSAVMVVTTVPQLAKEVHAAENQLPTKEQFATVDQLKSFNTDDTDGEKIRQRYIWETTVSNGGLREVNKNKD